MAARLKLYVDWFNKRLVQSVSNTGSFILPKFFQGDIVPIQIYIVEPDGGIGQSLVANDTMALKFAVSDTPTGTPTTPVAFVTQFTWSKNTIEKYFYADVAFNTAELDVFLGSAAEKTGYLELEITESSTITTIFQGSITIRAQIIETGTVSVAPGQTPLSLEVALQLFAKKVMDAGETITFTSADGTRQRMIGVRDDGSGIDDVL